MSTLRESPYKHRLSGLRMADGGTLRTGMGGRVPGTGTGDKIPAQYEPGEFVVSNAMLDRAPSLRTELSQLRADTLAAQGKTVAQADAQSLRYDSGPQGAPYAQQNPSLRNGGPPLGAGGGRYAEGAESPSPGARRVVTVPGGSEAGQDAPVRVAPEMGQPLDVRGVRGSPGGVGGHEAGGPARRLTLRAANGFTIDERPWAGSQDARTFARDPGPGNPNVGPSGSAQAQAYRAPPAAAPAAQGGRLRGAGNFLSSAGSSAGSVGGAFKSVAAPLARAGGASLRVASRLAAPLGAPAAAVTSAIDGLNTDTETYARRFGLEDTEPGVVRDLGIRALGVASDVGNNMTFGMAKKHLYRDDSPPIPAASAPTMRAGYSFPTGDAGRGTTNNPLRSDVNPGSMRFGASRDFSAELNKVPRDLPADMRDGVVIKTKDAQGRTTYSGRNVSGDTPQMVDGLGRDIKRLGQPTGNFVQSLDSDGKVDAFSAPGTGRISLRGGAEATAAAQRALTNPDGSRWSSEDNAIMAANLRDGVDPYRGTSRQTSMRGGGGGPDLMALAMSPNGTIGRKFARQMLLDQQGQETTRRGQDMSYDSSMRSNQASVGSATAKLRYDVMKDQRDFDVGRSDKALDNTRKANDDWNTQIGRTFVDADGKPDAQAASEFTRATDFTVKAMATDLLKSGDPAKMAYAKELAAKGRAALDPDDFAAMVEQYRVKRIGDRSGALMFGSTGDKTDDLRKYGIKGPDDGLLQKGWKTNGGMRIPEVNLQYGANASHWGWNSGPADTSLTPKRMRE